MKPFSVMAVWRVFSFARRAMPRSASFGVTPSAVNMMLSGLTSRWTTWCAATAASARATRDTMSLASSTESAPHFVSRSRTVPPGTYSIRM